LTRRFNQFNTDHLFIAREYLEHDMAYLPCPTFERPEGMYFSHFNRRGQRWRSLYSN